MGFAAAQPVLWPAPPDWSSPVSETLGWLTDQMQSTTGAQQVRMLRDTPRRNFSFQCIDLGDDRRIVDAIRFDLGVRPFYMAIWPDVQWLAAPLAMGITVIPCRTAGFDFVVGGKLALFQDATHWELATVAAIAVDSVTVAAPTAAAYGVGARLYPVRRARLADIPQETQQSSDVGTLQVPVVIDEPCDWTAAWPTTAAYRGTAVLEWRGDESQDPTDQYNRQGGSVDQDVGPVYYYDLPGMPFRTQSQLFTLRGRDSHTTFRSLAYQLAGRAGQVWVPDWQSSLRLLQPVGAGSTQWQFAPCFYSIFGAQQPNRRDVRIELYDGTVLYRRITGSAQNASGEVLQFDSAPGVAIDPSAVRQINCLSMCQQSADSVQIQHDTDADGVAHASLTWQAVKNNV